MRRGPWLAYGILLVTTLWFVFVATRQLGEWTSHLAGRLPRGLPLGAVLSIPVLEPLSRLRLPISWTLRLGMFLLVLASVPLLPVVFDTHPLIAVGVLVTFLVEEFAIIPLINRRWLQRNQ